MPDGGRIYGQSDLPCDCSDAAVFAALAAEVPAGAVWVTSNLMRTTQTAQAIHAADPQQVRRRGADAPCLTLPSSTWANGRGSTARRSMPSARSARTRSGSPRPTSVRRAGRASRTSWAASLRPLRASTCEHRGRDIVAVTHGGTIRAALGLALGLAPQAALAFATENCSLTRLDHLSTGDGGGLWRVVAVNRLPCGPRGPLLRLRGEA